MDELIFHKHTGNDAPKVSYNDLENKPVGIAGKLTMSGSQAIDSSSETLVNFDTSGFTAVGITVDATNKKMTILTAGKYLISVLLLYAATVDLKSYQIRIYKNGTGGTKIYNGFFTSNVASGTRNLPILVSDIFDLAANDYIEIYAYHTAGVAQSIGIGGDYFAIKS